MSFIRYLPAGTLPKAALLPAAICLIGCTSVKPYWCDRHTGATIVPHQLDTKFDEDLRIVEFDELGDLWSVKQRDDAVSFIKRKQNPLVIVFVHGWRNSAKPNNSDLNGFNQFIKDFKKNNGRKDIAAIYISWRGGVVAEPKQLPHLMDIPAFLSVWNRKDATDRMASIPMNDTFWKIKNATEGSVFLIGHSYGGRIVERCVGISLVGSNYERGAANRKNLPADLIMLINPASEGLYARQMKSALQGWKDTSPPGIISVTADSDTATGLGWGVAFNISSFFKGWYGNRTYPPDAGHPAKEKQSTYLTCTAGHDPRLIDWRTKIVLCEGGNDPHDAPALGAATVQYNLKHSAEKRWFWITSKAASHRYELYKPTLGKDYQNLSKEANGYWVIQVPREILNGHSGDRKAENGIFNDQMQALTAGLYAMSHPEDYKAPSKVPEDPQPPSQSPSAASSATQQDQPGVMQRLIERAVPSSHH